jgi:hypothetical protein
MQAYIPAEEALVLHFVRGRVPFRHRAGSAHLIWVRTDGIAPGAYTAPMSKRCGAFAVVLLAVILLPLAARGDKAAEATARKQATEMYQALVRGDLETFVGYMHPTIAEMMGGKEKVIDATRKALAASAAQGLTASKASVAPVQQLVEVSPAKLQVIVPADVTMSGKDAEVRQRSFLLGFSSDKGKTWKFVDTGSTGGDALRKILPECSPALKIPARLKPEVIRRGASAH